MYRFHTSTNATCETLDILVTVTFEIQPFHPSCVQKYFNWHVLITINSIWESNVLMASSCNFLPFLQVVSAIPVHLDGKSAPGQVPTGSVCYERNGVRKAASITACLSYERQC